MSERVGRDSQSAPSWLTAVRANPRQRLVALAVAVAVGMALTWVHWLGLFVAGALVGLVSKSLPRAVLAGVVFGLLVLLVQVLVSPLMSAGEFVALAPASYVAIGASIVAPVWGSLIRGVV